jgi:hypothetical protein
MRAYLKLMFVSLVIVGTTACEKNNSYNGEGPSCISDADCTAPLAVCDIDGTSKCVQCLPNTRTEACTGTTPVCGSSLECRACATDADCTSGLCLPSVADLAGGSCAAESAVVYLTPTGSGNNCTLAAPCNRMNEAVARVNVDRPYIKVSGIITEGESYISAKNVYIIGAEGAVLRGKGGMPDATLDLFLASNVLIYNLRFENADRIAIRVDNGSSVSIYKSAIVDAREEGLFVQNGKASVSQTEFINSGTNMPSRAIYLQNGEISVDRSRLFNSSGGGVFVNDNQKFSITNSFIVGNRVAGGVQASKPGASSRFEFNTIVDNMDAGGNGDAGGITCDDSRFSFSNNLIFRNTGGNGGAAQTFGACTYGNSFINAGIGPDASSLGFRSETNPRDYHLTASSPASVKDLPTAVCSGSFDYDGDARPLGAACDLGADEYKP